MRPLVIARITRAILIAFAALCAVYLFAGCSDNSRRIAQPLTGITEWTLLVKVDPKRQAEAIPGILDMTRSFAMASGSSNPPRLLERPELEKLGYLVFTTGDLYPDGVVSAIEAAPFVRTVIPDRRIRLTPPIGDMLAVPDPGINAQWAHAKLGSQAAWARGVTGKGVVVAVVDTGVQCSHPDLSGACVAAGRDFTGENSLSDPNGHGTHVAGTVAARNGNGIGGAGIAPDAGILSVRVLDAEGSGFDSWIASGIVYAVDRGAKIVNLSLGGDELGTVMRDAVQYGTQRGVIFTCAAGNEGSDVATYPNAYPECIGIAATKKDGEVGTTWTNWGVNADLGAPGESIMSTCITSRYCNMSGTSMAAPVAAGVVALALSGGVGWADVIPLINRTGVPLTGRLTGLKRPSLTALSGFLVPLSSSTSTPSTTRSPSTATPTRRPTATSTSSPTATRRTTTSTPRPSRTPSPRATRRPRWPWWRAFPLVIVKRR
ncbi:MAG: S8 family serine peptidase [Rhodocyclaceae bacterium]|nr:S8 family serine peptidase [Rhodocyclaceae bacterium]